MIMVLSDPMEICIYLINTQYMHLLSMIMVLSDPMEICIYLINTQYMHLINDYGIE